MDEEALRFEEALYTYATGQKPIIDIPAWTLKKGQKVCITGPSGSGKSTLISLISGVWTLDSGSIKVLGTDIGALSPVERDRFRADHIGLIFQQGHLLPYLNAGENIELALSYSPQKRAKVGTQLRPAIEKLLAELGLEDPDIWYRRLDQLSEGQRQRVAAARALLGEPELILADEPSSALDPMATRLLWQQILKVCTQAQSTLIVVTHDPQMTALLGSELPLASLGRGA